MKTQVKLVIACTFFAGIANLSAQTKPTHSTQNKKTNVKSVSKNSRPSRTEDPSLRNPIIVRPDITAQPNNDPRLQAEFQKTPGLKPIKKDLDQHANSFPEQHGTVPTPAEHRGTPVWQLDNDRPSESINRTKKTTNTTKTKNTSTKKK